MKCNEISENTPYAMDGIKKTPYLKQFQIGKTVKHFFPHSPTNAGGNIEQS